MTEPRTTIRFFDPHFHLWDVTPVGDATTTTTTTTTTKSGHDGKNLFAPAGSNLYGRNEYEAEANTSSSRSNSGIAIVHEGGVCIEANSVGFVDRDGSELLGNYRQELRWTLDQFSNNDGKTYRFLACASLEDPDVGSWLSELAREPLVCGIRQILNHQPSWPRNDRLGELLVRDDWKKGFAMMAEHDLVVDFQLNPSQFEAALAVLRESPGVNVVINHAGTPTLADLTNKDQQDIYWKGLTALADCSNVKGIKISMLSYISKDWDTNPIVIDCVHKIIQLFGVERVAMASNAPVDGHASSDSPWTIPRVVKAFDDMMTASGYTPEEREWLFAKAAKKMYGLQQD